MNNSHRAIKTINVVYSRLDINLRITIVYFHLRIIEFVAEVIIFSIDLVQNQMMT